jgi:hypothetical protein
MFSGLSLLGTQNFEFQKLRRPGGPPKKEAMSEARNITPATQFQPPAAKSTVESLHRAAVVGALEAKLRVARYRARVLFTDRADLLTGILTRLQNTIEELAAMPTRGVDEDPEHIGSIAHREMRRLAAERLTGDAL